MLIQQKSGLSNQADVPEKLIPSTFEGETSFQNEDNILILNCLYMTCYWVAAQIFLEPFRRFYGSRIFDCIYN
jgi:hypothetical protein